MKSLWPLSILALVILAGCAPPAEFSPDGKRIAVANPKGGVDVVDIATNKRKHHNVAVDPLLFISWSPDGKKLVVSDYDGMSGQASQKRLRAKSYLVDTVSGKVASLTAQANGPFGWVQGYILAGAEAGRDKGMLVWVDGEKTTEVKRQDLDSRIQWFCSLGAEALFRTEKSAYRTNKQAIVPLKLSGDLLSCAPTGTGATCLMVTDPKSDPTYSLIRVTPDGVAKPETLPSFLTKPARTKTRERIPLSVSSSGAYFLVVDVQDKSPKPILPQFRGLVTRTESQRPDQGKGLPDVKLDLTYRVVDKAGKELRVMFEGQWIDEDVLVADYRWSGDRLLFSVLDTVRERAQVRMFDLKSKKTTLLLDHKTDASK